MRTTSRVLTALFAASLAACERIQSTIEPDMAASVAPGAIVASASGGGQYLLAGLFDGKFAFTANAKSDGSAIGEFRAWVDFGGVVADIHGRVTCLSVDETNGRAWIGAVITSNTSTDPDLMDVIHQPGRDVWFRVLDAGEARGAEDRLTFLGFEGAGGIITSAEYCEARIWPAGNARTHPVTSGNIQVRGT